MGKIESNKLEGFCKKCNQKKSIIKKVIDDNSITINYICGHSSYKISIEESIKCWEKIKGKIRHGKKGEVAPHEEFVNKNEPSGDKNLPKGVRNEISIDRENNKYDQVVIDLNTNKIIHEEHEPLDQHSS